MSCYSQGDFSYSSSSKMTFPKPSASWSVSLISCFQNSEWNKAGSQRLSEGVRCWLKWQWCHGRGISLWVQTSYLHRWCSGVCQHSQEGRGDVSPEMDPGPRSIVLACWTPGVHWGWYLNWERSRTGGWPAVHFFGRQPQQKGSPVTWWMVSVSKLSMHL